MLSNTHAFCLRNQLGIAEIIILPLFPQIFGAHQINNKHVLYVYMKC
jgi:hypothetical protein